MNRWSAVPTPSEDPDAEPVSRLRPSGLSPSRWPRPMSEEARVRAVALTFLEEIERLVKVDAAPERIAATARDAIARLTA